MQSSHRLALALAVALPAACAAQELTPAELLERHADYIASLETIEVSGRETIFNHARVAETPEEVEEFRREKTAWWIDRGDDPALAARMAQSQIDNEFGDGEVARDIQARHAPPRGWVSVKGVGARRRDYGATEFVAKGTAVSLDLMHGDSIGIMYLPGDGTAKLDAAEFVHDRVLRLGTFSRGILVRNAAYGDSARGAEAGAAFRAQMKSESLEISAGSAPNSVRIRLPKFSRETEAVLLPEHGYSLASATLRWGAPEPKVRERVSYDDYRLTDGVWLPFRAVWERMDKDRNPDETTTLEIEEVRVNPPLARDDFNFTLPAGTRMEAQAFPGLESSEARSSILAEDNGAMDLDRKYANRAAIGKFADNFVARPELISRPAGKPAAPPRREAPSLPRATAIVAALVVGLPAMVIAFAMLLRRKR